MSKRGGEKGERGGGELKKHEARRSEKEIHVSILPRLKKQGGKKGGSGSVSVGKLEMLSYSVPSSRGGEKGAT